MFRHWAVMFISSIDLCIPVQTTLVTFNFKGRFIAISERTDLDRLAYFCIKSNLNQINDLGAKLSMKTLLS